jgi:hypothetical protein
MPTAVHELFIARVEDAIFSQLKSIRGGSDKAAGFAQKLYAARSTEVNFPVENEPNATNSKHEPDASFWHEAAEYPGVIIEVAYSQKKKRLDRLADNYLLDSDASVQVVVGLDVEYGKKGSRKATLSVWRPKLFHNDEGDELRVVEEVRDEVRPPSGVSNAFVLTRDCRHFVTSMGTLRIILAYDYGCLILLVRSLQET